jgi:hypothetical protein
MDLKIKALKVGAILKSSWGYDQTNVDFYVVTKGAEVGRFLGLAKIASTLIPSAGFSPMAGKCTAALVDGKPQIIGEAFKAKLTEYGSVKVRSCARAWLWDGQPAYVSWYA